MVWLIYFSTFIFSFLTLSSADDAAVMAKLLASFSTAPSGWSNSTDYCKWTNVICKGSSVTEIRLISQSLSGTLPSDLGTLTRLESLSLQQNSLYGPIPSFANLTSLRQLYLDNNKFSSIPSGFFQGLTSLQILILSENLNLTPWTIPTELTQASSLATFYASNANIIGSLPDFFESFPSLHDLRLSFNNISGTFPKSFGGSGIQYLLLDNQQNGLSGTIDVLSSMTQLKQVWLGNNNFTGPIPDLSNCTSLFDLQLSYNHFTGLIPASLMSIPSLRNISLDNNELQGPYPQFPSSVTTHTIDGINRFCKGIPGPCDPQVTTLLEIAAALGYPIKLANSWTGNNACSGWTSIICDPQGNIIAINFAKQQLVGTISPAFAKLTWLMNLYLGDNNLTGSIPDALINMTSLKVLDVSNNNLTGLIPKFGDSVNLTTTGNPLIGKNGTLPTGNTAGTGSSGTSVSPGIIAGIVIAVIILSVVVLFVSIKCYVSSKHRKFVGVENPENGGTSVLNIEISIEVLEHVTNNFNEDNILGRGGSGVVYKGENHDGTIIAVKRMESTAMSRKGINEFQAEISVLTKARHRHLVALLGYCINGNERFLVYEYMPQGTLTQHLFDLGENGCSPLTWKQRIQIAMDVARGVEYLHSLTTQIFIHRDLKPSNILLGDDMRAKIADFGLVKIALDEKYPVSTRVAGTFGYLAPEYGATGTVTTKADVYAFGVVLMQLISGRKAVDDTLPDENPHLVTWFCRILNNKETIANAIDQTINPDEETMESIYKVAELAGLCTSPKPYQRPDMGYVVNILSPLVGQWKPACPNTSNGVEDIYSFDQSMSLPQDQQRWQTM